MWERWKIQIYLQLPVSARPLYDFTIKTHWSDPHCVQTMQSGRADLQYKGMVIFFLLHCVAWMDAWVINLYKERKMACVYRPC